MKKPSIQNILVPIDFSEMSIDAIKTARQLAQRFAASIHLAHVRQVDCTMVFAAPSPPLVPFSFMHDDQEGGKRILEELNVLARENGISSASCHVLAGGPAFDEICGIAQEIPADLIVMPTRGRTGLKHMFLGSTAERIVQHSPCPVLVTRGHPFRSGNGSRLVIHTVLVPVDFSDRSRQGLQYATGFADEFGAEIILLHATYFRYIYSSEGNAIYDNLGLQEAVRENAERRMRKLVRTAKFGRTKHETALTDGSPALDICAFAKQHHVDLIITSTHGFTGLKHVLMGSVSEQVVRRAACSVLVVPSHPKVRVANLSNASERKIPHWQKQQQSRKSPKDKALTKRDRKLAAHMFPERRKTNKFRELARHGIDQS